MDAIAAGYCSATHPGTKNVAGTMSSRRTARMRESPTFGPYWPTESVTGRVAFSGSRARAPDSASRSNVRRTGNGRRFIAPRRLYDTVVMHADRLRRLRLRYLLAIGLPASLLSQ